MDFIADTHLHIYPFYKIDTALNSLIKNLAKLAPGSTKVGCLTERYDCNVYNQLATSPPETVCQEFNITPSSTGNSLKIKPLHGNSAIFLLPGQQIITAENLEILSLNCIHRVKEGNSAAHTITEVIQNGGIPVIAWGFGKWLGKRGTIVGQMLDLFTPDQIAIGDTTMRPTVWPTPTLFRKAKSKGYKILFGSDPLPFRGEEIRPGSYATKLLTRDNNSDPGDAFKNILSTEIDVIPAGNRNSLIDVFGRMRNHRETSRITTSSI